MTEQKHIHKYKRLKYKSGNVTFFCTLPDCSHKINPALALGKRSICWRCEEPFILNEYSLRLAKPHCELCHKPKNMPEVKDDEVRIPVESSSLSLADRLQQTINKVQIEGEEDI